MTARPVPVRPGTGRAPWPTCDTCGQPLPPDTDCACGHPEVVHDIRKDRTRGACTHHEGPKGTPCGCRTYTKEAT